MTNHRFRPTRAGIINIWDYVDEEFAFADGRLALRGHNGSGKTKALEVLFPFVFDGVADSRRLDPFSGENRTMKSNLLYRGQEAEYGYVWMEFAQASPAETVTLVIGLRAHRNRDGVRSSFFVTGKRLGVDFGLLSADSRPLTETQLKSVLEPDAWHKTATSYRDAIDTRLFGLGRERYAQLLDLLLALRRPLLAKDLDPVKVSDTLTSGLSPVDDELVQQAARDFENLAAVQKLFDDLTTAGAAVREFLTHYVSYLRTHTRFYLDKVQARTETAAGHAAQIAAAAAEHSRAAAAAEREAEKERNASQTKANRLTGRLTGLKSSDEYKAQESLEGKRRAAATGARDVAEQRTRLERDRKQIDSQREAAAKLTTRATNARAAESGFATALADAAERSGIADDGSGPADTGADLPTAAQARAVARRDDIQQTRQALGAAAAADTKRKHLSGEAERKATAAAQQQEACDEAADRLDEARRTAARELTAWSARWAAPAAAGPDASPASASGLDSSPASTPAVAGPDVNPAAYPVTASESRVLAGALDQIGEAAAPTLSEVFARLTSARQAAAITAQATCTVELDTARERLDDLRAEREAIATEQNDAPSATDLRTASREGRSGGPLWQLVRFADGIDALQAAAVEGALYGAGLLTAWIHPDPALTAQALAAAESDAYLTAAAEPAPGRTLADILVPEDQDRVAAPIIEATLRSIALTDDLATAADSRAAAPSAPPLPAVSTKAQFSYGVHAGARPKPEPEYIGAANRATRRRARLDAQDKLIAQAEANERRLSGELTRAEDLLEALQQAQQELPNTAPVAQAAGEAGKQAVLLARARAEHAEATKNLDTAIAEADAKRRLLRQTAAECRLPTEQNQIDEIAAAVTEFLGAATQLHSQRTTRAQAEEDLAEQTAAVERLTGEYAAAESALADRERAQQALESELPAQEEKLGAGVQQVLDQIKQTERLISAASTAAERHDTIARKEHDKATIAAATLTGERRALGDAVTALFEQAREFGPYTQAELRPLIGVPDATPWPPDSRWPDPVEASDQITAQLAGPTSDPVATVRAALPAPAVRIIDAYQAATRGGRQPGENTLKNTQDRMSVALKDFTEALAACDEDYRVDWMPGGVVTVHVLDDEGRKPVATFAARIAERQADQGVLLEERERKVLEDELLTTLADQIHGRVIAARDLVRDMDADTRSKPMSSGLAVGIRWAQSDKITDRQRAASRLLERAAPGYDRLTELRGLLREMIREYRASHPRATYREALGSVLDYRSWHVFELILLQPGEPEVRLTQARHSVMSGGEKSAAIHLPLFAAANALYSSANEHSPRMIALDEAFVGIDERYKPDLFGLAVKFGLDLFMTGHDLWVTYGTVPMIAHYDMYHDKLTHAVSSMLLLWDGKQLLDDAGYADSSDIATRLLGFRPTRHAPLGTDDSLYAVAAADDAQEDDDEAGIGDVPEMER